MPIAQQIYNTVIRRNFAFVGTIFVSAFLFEIAFDRTIDKVWDNLNKGRQWKDIRNRYVESDDD